ncbi:MAG TPA: penicillin-binding protein 2 [Candidatus Angelobacter sp.]|nr:penicillin-binding protein 2 [Candidatus Angelobacter sp.]
MVGRDAKISSARFTAVQYVIMLAFLVLAYGLWSLQVRHTEELQTKAEQQRIKRVPIVAPRGKILDRDEQEIVKNYPSFSALLLRDQMRDLNADAQKIAAGLNIPVDEILDKIRRAQLAHLPAFQPIIVKDDITHDDLSFIESHKDDFPELETLMVHRRLYPKDGFMAHLIGYVGEVSEDMLNTPQFETYERGDIVGQSGVELYYNDVLKGRDGSRKVLVNSKGKEVGRPKDANVPAVAGKELKLTIDIDIQKAAEQALEGKNGAIVALDPRNGEVLAMVSRPAFDPNDFAIRISAKEWKQLTDDPDHPLLNKAIQAQVAPGSVFKIIMSLAGLEEGVAQTLNVNCQGGGIFFGSYHECWIKHDPQRAHGSVGISKGIYQSCDVFFYTLAEKLGIEKIAKWATAVGIGKKTGIDLPNEVSGVMPSEEWKIKNFHQRWYAGEVISVGIGQGAVAVSPIQIARAIGGIAMGGTFYRPHVVDLEQLPAEYKYLAKAEGGQPEVVHLPLDPQSWITITDAMANVVNPIGTAAASHLQGVDFAGKTGSTQKVSHHYLETHGLKEKNLKGELKGNGWFAGVTPRRNPEIVVVVYFEGGEHGPLAARIAAQVIKLFVEKQRRVRNNPLLFSDKLDPGSVPIAGLWSAPSENDAEGGNEPGHFQGGTMLVRMTPERRKHLKPASFAVGTAAVGTAGTD